MTHSTKLHNWRKGPRRVLIGLVILLAIGVVCFFHYLFISPALDYYNKDFMTFWAGGRAILDGVNPYDEGLWRPLRTAYGSEWMPNPRFPYPIWTALFATPFALLPVPLSAALWLAIQECLLVVSALILLRLYSRWQLGIMDVMLLAVAGFTSVAMVLILVNGQITLYFLFVLTLFLYLYEQKRLLQAGAVLALLALKPNPFIAFVPFIGIWLLWKRDFRVVIGGGLAATGMFVLGWLMEPGWIAQWANVRSKSEVVTITPTLWGLAAEVGGALWMPIGFALVVILLVFSGYTVFSRPHLKAPVVAGIGLAVSLLATPYAWSYEHGLLFIPWLWLFAQSYDRRQGMRRLFILVSLVPWSMFALAVLRINDSLGFVVPLVTLGVLVGTIHRGKGGHDLEGVRE